MNFKIFIAVVLALVLAGWATLRSYMLADLLGGLKYLKNATRAFEDIEIRTLENGVKYIEAETYEGAHYGIGVIHARDRLW